VQKPTIEVLCEMTYLTTNCIRTPSDGYLISTRTHASPRLHNSSNADHKSGSSDSALLKCLIAASLRSERLEQKQRQTAISVQVYAALTRRACSDSVYISMFKLVPAISLPGGPDCHRCHRSHMTKPVRGAVAFSKCSNLQVCGHTAASVRQEEEIRPAEKPIERMRQWTQDFIACSKLKPYLQIRPSK
jgi:hypothetical protein